MNDRSLSQQIDALASKSNLTTGQLLLWLGQQLNPDAPLYNMVFSFTIQGDVDPVHFQRAFQALVDRCDILRLTIAEMDGVPQQRVAPALQYTLPFIDFSTETDPHSAAQRWIHQRSTDLLNLEQRLFDSALLKLVSDELIWYFNQHHLITDNWSVSLLYRRLQEYYQKSIGGALSEVTALPAYIDIAVTKEQPQSSWQQQAVIHWQQKREAISSSVPLYGQATESATTRTERTYFELDQPRSEALRALAKTPEARTLSIHQSQFNLFLTLVFAYLHRISGETELAIAAPAHNRPTPALKETPGVFMELFPLQVEISPGETFTSLLEKVARESMAFLRYAQSGVSHHGMNRNVNVVLSYINVTFPEFAGMPAHTNWIHSGYGDSQHHLRLEVHDFNATGNFTLQFDFNCDLIPVQQRQWAPEHFCKLLDAWLEDGQQPIGSVDILAAEERALLCDRTVSAHSIFPTEEKVQEKAASTLVEQFQQQVKLLPDQTAVVFSEQSLTYAELECQANQLAYYLYHQGIHKGMTVGLFMERSTALVVSILGILKAGAAYLPIDPAYPADRTNFMVQDGQVSLILIQQSLLEKCPECRVLCLEEHQQSINQQSTDAPDIELTAKDLAYILFTSGSTGKPKGVMVEHCNVLAMLRGFEQTAPAGEQLRGTVLCSYGFDVSVWEIFSNLCFGGTLHLVPAEVITDSFVEYLLTHDVTSAYIPPALLPVVIQELEKTTNEIALNRILVGVEPIPQELLQRYRQRIPDLRIVNGYGPTETTICATFYSFDQVTNPQGITPIGKAIPGYEVYLINPQGQQVPIGVKGEIVIGGAGLSRGYLNRPELTAERFTDNPFGTGKLYKTGDQARYLLDGNLEFLGRLDQQVKIRGFRVELREVEAALTLHPSVQQAAVLAQSASQGNQSLIAYLVATDSITSSEIRTFLQQKLPDYMVPSSFAVLDRLPLTPNGKVDRRQLLASDYDQLEKLDAGTDYTAPTNEWEIYLTKLWAQCLRVESVGIHDNFFDLGGDSITAIQIAAQATEAGLALSPQQILQQLTVSGILAQVAPVCSIEDEQTQSTSQIPLNPVQQSFFEQVAVEPHHWNQSLVLEIDSPIDSTALETALRRLIQHHAVLRSTFKLGESSWQQQVSSKQPDKLLETVDLLQRSAADQKQVIAAVEARLQASLNLSIGKLVQAALFDSGDQRSLRLLLIVHHLAVDGVSWLTLLNDLESFYREAQGETVTRPLPTTSFQSWAAQLVKKAESGAFQSELEYWMRPVRKAISSLPKDAETADNTVAAMQTVTVCLDVGQTRQLLKKIPKVARAQVNEILLTALVQALNGKLLLDLEGHGREEAIVPGVNLVRTVGWFTTVYPLWLTLPQSDIGNQLQAVKEQVRGVPNRGIGYGLLRYCGDAEVRAKLEALPQAEVLFNYLGDLAGLVPPGSMFGLARELQLSRSPKGQRRYVLEVNAAVVEGQLQVEWSYGERMHRRETVERWANEMLRGVRSQINYHLSSNRQPTTTSIDFPLANLNNQKLSKIAALLNKTKNGQ